MRYPDPRSLLAALVLAGCATTQSAEVGDEAPAGSGPARWTGQLNPTTQRTGAMVQADQARAFGTVTLVPSSADVNRTDVRLAVTVPGSASNSSLPWAILPGRCGSGSIPLATVDLFPPVEVGNNARGELSVTIPLTLPTSGNFHVNVYWPGGSQLSDVMTCGNLRRGG